MTDVVPGLVSTIIPVFNRPEMLRESVQSVLDQTYRCIEILIADDGSTDETPQIGRELQQQHAGLVKLLQIEGVSGQGPGPMRELGRQHARGEFLQYLDSDDRLLPNKFAEQVEVLRKNPDCEIAYGITRLIDESGRLLKEPFKWTGKEMPQLYPGLLVDRWWCTHTPLYRRSLCDCIGPWSTLRWSQDWEYDARAGELGAKLISTGTAVSEHRHHSGVRQTSNADWQRDPVRLRNRCELLMALWRHLPTDLKTTEFEERQHFARWSFAVARMCAAAGLQEEMNCLLALAEEAAGQAGAGRRGVVGFRMLSRIAGPKMAGCCASWIDAFRRKPGTHTLPQSFMEARRS